MVRFGLHPPRIKDATNDQTHEDLRGLVQKSADADASREMISFAAGWLMELEVVARTNAEYGEKSAERMAVPDPCGPWGTENPAAMDATLFAILPRVRPFCGKGADGRNPRGLCS